MGGSEFTGTQQEWDELVEKERQRVAKDLNIPVEQIETLSKEEQSKPVSQNTQEDGEEEVKKFIENEDNKKHAQELAHQIQQVCGEKWFTLDKFVKRTSETKQTAFQKLKLCELFGLVAIRVGDYKDDRKLFRETLFKVTVSIKSKVEAIDRIIEYHKGQIEAMSVTKKSLENKIEATFSSDSKEL